MSRHVRGLATIATAIALPLLTACKEPPPAAPPPPPEVGVAEVVKQDVPIYLELTGQTVGYQDVEIRARVEGFLQSMNFTEGSFVRKGAPLYVIDRAPLQTNLAKARAEQATAQARLDKTNNDVARYTPLAAKQAVSRQELDNALAAQDAAKSELEASKAAVDKASLDLGYTTIASPIDGLVGTTLVKAGNLVGRGENTLLTTISQIDPILFRVGVTEADYLKIARRNGPGGNAAKGAGGNAASGEGLELILSDGTVYPQRGKLGNVDRAVDPTTGTLGVQFVFPNPDRLLRPGQFGRVRGLIDTKKDALLVPQRAVQEVQGQYSVAAVDSAGKVAFQRVKVGPKVNQLWVIEDGVQQGQRVVVEGLQRVQEGMTVTAKAAQAPADASAAATTNQPEIGAK